MLYDNYSVLMSVYNKEKPAYLKESIDSMLRQTVKTNNFVLVCDGQLSDELNNIILDFEKNNTDIFVVKRLKQNRGLAEALRYGIQFCTNELIARMDSDDVAVRNRCERQLEIFRDNINISIVGGAIEEFVGDTSNIICSRKLPEKNSDIVKFAKFRSPFNHPTVMYKKSIVLQSGNYENFYLLEDYYLWIRMLKNGAEGFNLKETLVFMRTSNDFYKRRSGAMYAVSQYKLAEYMRSVGFISFFDFILNCLLKCSVALLPNVFRKYIYIYILRQCARSATNT